MANTNELQNTLKSTSLSKEVFTVLITECLLCYLHNESIIQIFKLFTSFFNEVALIYYDLISPNDEFGKVMIRNLKQYRNINLPSYEDCPHEESHIKRCFENGFDFRNICIDMLSYFNSIIPHEEQIYVNKIEMMDELEEWNLLQKHYCIGVAFKINKGYEYISSYELK